MATCVSSYPTELPLGCVQQLIDIIRGGTIQANVKEFAAAAWSVIGYCLKTFVGEPLPVINGAPPQPAVSAAARAQIAELRELLITTDLLPASAAQATNEAQPVGSQLSMFLRTVVVPMLVAALKKLLDSLAE